MAFRHYDYCLDLIFHSHQLFRLSTVELNLGRFKPSYKVQMHFFLKCLVRNEAQDYEGTDY